MKNVFKKVVSGLVLGAIAFNFAGCGDDDFLKKIRGNQTIVNTVMFNLGELGMETKPNSEILREGFTAYTSEKSNEGNFNESILIVLNNQDEVINNSTYRTLCNRLDNSEVIDDFVSSYSCGDSSKKVVDSFNLMYDKKIKLQESDRAIKITFKKIETLLLEETLLEEAKREEAERASK